jgi:hypothetical protein
MFFRFSIPLYLLIIVLLVGTDFGCSGTDPLDCKANYCPGVVPTDEQVKACEADTVKYDRCKSQLGAYARCGFDKGACKSADGKLNVKETDCVQEASAALSCIFGR